MAYLRKSFGELIFARGEKFQNWAKLIKLTNVNMLDLYKRCRSILLKFV